MLLEFFNEEESFDSEVTQEAGNKGFIDDLKLDFETQDEDLNIDDETDETTLLD
jgi:hypothetical protein